MELNFKLKYDPSGRFEARAEFYGNKVLIGKKFFDLPDRDSKKFVIAHKARHLFEDILPREFRRSLAGGNASKILGVMRENQKGDLWYDGFLGGYNPSEAWGNAVAQVYMTPIQVKKHNPEIYWLVITTLPKGWKSLVNYLWNQVKAVEHEYKTYYKN